MLAHDIAVLRNHQPGAGDPLTYKSIHYLERRVQPTHPDVRPT
jgi:hypothetical protein